MDLAYPWTPACAGVTTTVIFISSGEPQAHENSLENHPISVIPAKAGTHLLVDPRLRGGDNTGDFHLLG
jgi:hypothetical protein